jgi:hypothetical protein
LPLDSPASSASSLPIPTLVHAGARKPRPARQLHGPPPPVHPGGRVPPAPSGWTRRTSDAPSRFLSERGLPYVCVDEPGHLRHVRPSSRLPPASPSSASTAAPRGLGQSGTSVGSTTGSTPRPTSGMGPQHRSLADESDSVHLLMNNCREDKAVVNAKQLALMLSAEAPSPAPPRCAGEMPTLGFAHTTPPFARLTGEVGSWQRSPGGGTPLTQWGGAGGGRRLTHRHRPRHPVHRHHLPVPDQRRRALYGNDGWDAELPRDRCRAEHAARFHHHGGGGRTTGSTVHR